LNRFNKRQIELATSNETEFAKKTQSYRKIVKILTKKNEELEAKINELRSKPESAIAQSPSIHPQEAIVEKDEWKSTSEQLETFDSNFLAQVIRFVVQLVQDRRLQLKTQYMHWISDLDAVLELDGELKDVNLKGVDLCNEQDILEFIMDDYEDISNAYPTPPESSQLDNDAQSVKETQYTTKQGKAFINQRIKSNVPPYKNLPDEAKPVPVPKNEKIHTIGVQTTTKVIVIL
jgi:hypothetical protein